MNDRKYDQELRHTLWYRITGGRQKGQGSLLAIGNKIRHKGIDSCVKHGVISLLLALAVTGITPAYTVRASDNRMIPQAPEYNEDGSQVTFSNIYFGSYPQSEVKDTALTSTIVNASYDNYGDAWVGGMKYHRISAEDTNNAEQFGNGTYRYFKWERLKWRVLGNDGDTLFVMADKGLDCQSYHEVDAEVTWEDCSLRKWLNGNFFHTAFSKQEREAVKQYKVDNSAYAPQTVTDDYIYVPSMEELAERKYGFPAGIGTPTPCRQVPVSEYAYARGARVGDEQGKGEQNGWWWMRNPAVEEESPQKYAALVNQNGAFSMYGRVQNKYRAVVPVMHISVSSDAWYSMDDGTSGSGGGETATEPLKVSAPKMLRSQNVTSFKVEAAGGLTSDYTYQWYYAPAETGNGFPLSASSYHAIVWEGPALYIDMNAKDVPDGLYLYCAVSDGRTTVTSDRAWFSKKKTKQTIIYNKGPIKNGQVEYGASFPLKATCNGAASKISYKSSDPKILSVSASGKVKAKGFGKAVITITASDSHVDEYGKTDKKLSLTVLPKQVKITKVNQQKDSQGKLISVTVNWKPDKSIDGFQYSVAYNPEYTNGMNGEKPGKENAIKLSYIDVSKNKLYIRIRAYKKVGKKTYYGKWSSGYILKL